MAQDRSTLDKALNRAMSALRGAARGAFEQLGLPFDDERDRKTIAAVTTNDVGASTAAGPAPDPLRAAGQGRHRRPHVDRTLRVQGEHLEYRLRRARRKSIGIVVDDNGVTVSAPRWVAIREIEGFMREKKRWIDRARLDWQVYVARREALRPRWQHGAAIPVLGVPRQLAVRSLAAGERPHAELSAGATTILVRVADPADPQQIERCVAHLLDTMARKTYGERIAHYATTTGLIPTRWRLSRARTRWGSCSADGTVLINRRLIQFEPAVIDYVIVHELAHLRHPDHSPRFWARVESVLPDYRAARKRLNEYPSDI
jgi:hypothetical protein